MPRTLILSLFFSASLLGCTTQEPAPTSQASSIAYPTVREWLQLSDSVGAMSASQVQSKLLTVKPPASATQLFLYGLLKQQLGTPGALAEASQSFAILEKNSALADDHRQLAGILRQYTQSRLDSYNRERELQLQEQRLQAEVATAEQEKTDLEQKIQALTDLEAVISTRKEE
ncbi:MAG: hypothetical protein AAGA91_00140 [Pseudomonadota bacterium]